MRYVFSVVILAVVLTKYKEIVYLILNVQFVFITSYTILTTDKKVEVLSVMV